MKYTNKLIHETSPYLLQHAHNPVDWYPWGEEAFEKAQKENKPVLVSIGYSTCHWCHVMERESFENEEIADFMNRHFINIKVDREERPDIDQIYMDAVQAISGSCGWPLNCFLMPDKRPFYGGTYFPPVAAYRRPSWKQLLFNISQTYQNQPETIEKQATELMNLIQKSVAQFSNKIEGLTYDTVFNETLLENIYYGMRHRFDGLEGGFGNAPKFPSTMSLTFLLHYHEHTKNQPSNNGEALKHVLLSLDKMIMGGIYDQIGGGFSRYSTDREWLVPHFEKMLYDNALLVILLSEVYQYTKQPLYKQTIEDTLTFIRREMTNINGGFYSAQDADSEGVEGKYYTWTEAEILAVLGDDALLFNAFYDVSKLGNWEGRNILWRSQKVEQFAKQYGMITADVETLLKKSANKLFKVRNKRIKPGLDDKILLDWNALMCTAYAKAYQALGEEKYKEAAETTINFLLEKLQIDEKGHLYHTYKDGKAQYDAFLNDYAYLIEALLQIYFVTFNTKYLNKAEQYTNLVIDKFLDTSDQLFFFTSAEQKDIIARKKDIYDSALPSGNATMILNLQYLGKILAKNEYRTLAKDMLLRVYKTVENYPTSFAKWAKGIMNEVYDMTEVAIVGKKAITYAKELHQQFIPSLIVMASEKGGDDYPLLKNRIATKETLVYVCKNYTCKLPVNNLEDLAF